MNLFDLTPQQLKRAASLKERIDGLNKQLRTEDTAQLFVQTIDSLFERGSTL